MFALAKANEGPWLSLCPLVARQTSPTAKLQPAVEKWYRTFKCETKTAPSSREEQGCERSFSTHFYSSKENMKHVNLWLLIALLGVGSLLGCSRVYTTAPVSSSIRKPFEVGPETTKGKPSACIKWVRGSGRTSKLPRKAVRISDPAAAAVDREKKLQADNEDHPQ